MSARGGWGERKRRKRDEEGRGKKRGGKNLRKLIEVVVIIAATHVEQNTLLQTCRLCTSRGSYMNLPPWMSFCVAKLPIVGDGSLQR